MFAGKFSAARKRSSLNTDSAYQQANSNSTSGYFLYYGMAVKNFYQDTLLSFCFMKYFIHCILLLHLKRLKHSTAKSEVLNSNHKEGILFTSFSKQGVIKSPLPYSLKVSQKQCKQVSQNTLCANMKIHHVVFRTMSRFTHQQIIVFSSDNKNFLPRFTYILIFKLWIWPKATEVYSV